MSAAAVSLKMEGEKNCMVHEIIHLNLIFINIFKDQIRIGSDDQMIHVPFGHTIMYLNIGTPKTINFPFGTNGKLMVLGVPTLSTLRYSVLPIHQNSSDLGHQPPCKF